MGADEAAPRPVFRVVAVFRPPRWVLGDVPVCCLQFPVVALPQRPLQSAKETVGLDRGEGLERPEHLPECRRRDAGRVHQTDERVHMIGDDDVLAERDRREAPG